MDTGRLRTRITSDRTPCLRILSVAAGGPPHPAQIALLLSNTAIPLMDHQATTGPSSQTIPAMFILLPDISTALRQIAGVRRHITLSEPRNDTKTLPMSRRGAGVLEGNQAPGRGPLGVRPTKGIVGMAQGVTLTPTGSPDPLTFPRENPECSMRGTHIQRGTGIMADPCRLVDGDIMVEIQGRYK